MALRGLTNFFTPKNETEISFSNKLRIPYIVLLNSIFFFTFLGIFILRSITGKILFDAFNICLLLSLFFIVTVLILLKKSHFFPAEIGRAHV